MTSRAVLARFPAPALSPVLDTQMTEHPDDHGQEPSDGHDPPREETHHESAGEHPEDFLRPGHTAEGDLYGHGHEEPALNVSESQASSDHHGGEPIAHDGAEFAVSSTTDAQAALSTPGGTAFDLVPDAEPEWIAGHDESIAVAGVAGAHYAAVWAADDGTGVTAALLAGVGESAGGWHPDPDVAGTIPGHLAVLGYGGAGGISGTAARLWAELVPGSPVPHAQAGAHLSVVELLTELSRRVEDPVSRNVVDAALRHAIREGAGS